MIVCWRAALLCKAKLRAGRPSSDWLLTTLGIRSVWPNQENGYRREGPHTSGIRCVAFSVTNQKLHRWTHNNNKSLKDNYNGCLLFHLHTAGRSWHEVGVNVGWLLSESYSK